MDTGLHVTVYGKQCWRDLKNAYQELQSFGSTIEGVTVKVLFTCMTGRALQ